MRHDTAAILEKIFTELAARSDAEGYTYATDDDLDSWASDLGITWLTALDVIGAELARRYHRHDVSYEFGDSLANDLESALIFRHEQVPDGAWPKLWAEVYEAFDAGEWQPKDDSECPVKKFTDPSIAEIVAKLA